MAVRNEEKEGRINKEKKVELKGRQWVNSERLDQLPASHNRVSEKRKKEGAKGGSSYQGLA